MLVIKDHQIMIDVYPNMGKELKRRANNAKLPNLKGVKGTTVIFNGLFYFTSALKAKVCYV